MKKMRSFLSFAVVIALMYASAVFGYQAGMDSIPSIEKVQGVENKETQIEDIDFQIFWDAWSELEQRHVDRKDFNKQEMVYGAVRGLVDSIADPYTSFFKPESAKIFKEDVNGSFSGMGAEIGFRKGYLTVISPLKDSPAEKAGIKAGDIIAEIDGESTIDITLEEAVSRIRGERGTDVILTIIRENSDEEPKKITITRDLIKIPTIDTEIREGDIGYIKLYNFTGNVTALFDNAVRDLKKEGAKKFIVDVRNNPGGFLEAAIDISSMIVPKGDVVVTEDYGNGKSSNEHRSAGYGTLERLPLVVLINEGSASASEILAGAVKGKDHVKVIGITSFGKGSVQEVIDLRDETFIKVTIAKWLTPDGTSIQDNGITPDIEIKQNEEESVDAQLDEALEVINSL